MADAPPLLYRFDVRVYYEDTDAGGIVYYANYLKFAERARTEWVRSLGVSQADLWHKDGIGFVVRHVTVDYQKPARLDDLLTVEVRCLEKRMSALTLIQPILCAGVEIASVRVVLVCVNRDMRPVRLPDYL
ncbi:MAG: tol-pal system-associated acyl-CoA thioesterase [Alphaproteobacteria bacterium]|nr:MAG: tol-pal system-associated acyl-CoA thioesterase [Alphaproteobacteria bacterium]